MIARGDLARRFEAVERRLARRRLKVAAPSLKLAREHRHQGVVRKLVVIVEIFVAKRAEHALPNKRRHRVFDEPWVSGVAEASRKPPNHIQTPVRGAQQQTAPDVSAPPSNSATTGRPSTCPNALSFGLYSVCIGHLSESAQVVITKHLSPDLETRCAALVEKCGLASSSACSL